MPYKAVATCAFGLESVLAYEIKKLGVENVCVTDGRITFDASSEQIALANITLRTAERVLLVLASFHASTFDELFDGTREVRWRDYIGQTDAFPVKGYSMNSMLTSVPACQSVMKKAVVERLKSDYSSPFLTEKSGITKRIQFSIVKDVCTVMLDTSGDGLHKRGYRPLLNEAPIKETLAAGICDLARINADSSLTDPFCGSGTLVIEAALRARGIAPGISRHFAAEDYSFLGDNVFALARERARSEQKPDADFFGCGYDIDPDAVELAKQNAKRAGVSDAVRFEQADARKLKVQSGTIVLANPPYGERLMGEREVEALYRDFGANMRAQTPKGVYVITSHPEFEKLYGKAASRRRKLYNGMIPCSLFMYF